MLGSYRGVVLEVSRHFVKIDGEMRMWDGGTVPYSVVAFSTRDEDPGCNVGDWVDVRGGGFSGFYSVTQLAVFA